MNKILSERIKKYNNLGYHLNDKSKINEKLLNSVIDNYVIPYAENKIKNIFGNNISIIKQKNISLYECQMFWFQENNFNETCDYMIDENNRRFKMEPDGGILFAIIKEKKYPILITEDKNQGTNDILFSKGLKKQSTGNAIERGIKNIRGAEMLFDHMVIFPYVMFCSGCDLHSSETIANRLEMGNYGVKNHTIYINNEKSKENISNELEEILNKINIKKRYGNKSIASIFVKSHKWDKMVNGSSNWNEEELIKICFCIIDKVVDELRISLC